MFMSTDALFPHVKIYAKVIITRVDRDLDTGIFHCTAMTAKDRNNMPNMK